MVINLLLHKYHDFIHLSLPATDNTSSVTTAWRIKGK